MLPADLFRRPNALAADYSHFRVSERLLLTGHSHQAWPDVGFAAAQRCWLDAAEFVDDKWGRVFEMYDATCRGYAGLLNEPAAAIALGQNTLELVARFVSALPLTVRPRLVATDGEFHTVRRLLDRLSEDGIEVVKVPAFPVDTLAERLAAEVTDRTAAVFCSTVLFQSARIVPNIPHLAETCARHGTELLLDTYHHLNAVPFDPTGLGRAYVTGGGYKYCQLGEGACFLRLPPGCELRPVTTGWFTEFGELATGPRGGVAYGVGGMRFIGATFDPTSFYRAGAVFGFFRDRGLTPEFLRTVSRHQVGVLAERFDALDLNPAVVRRDTGLSLARVGGFLVLESPHAGDVCKRLKAAGVWADSRGSAVRLGPAPYLCDDQLHEAMAKVGEVCRGLTPPTSPAVSG
jgi:kynureninase